MLKLDGIQGLMRALWLAFLKGVLIPSVASVVSQVPWDSSCPLLKREKEGDDDAG